MIVIERDVVYPMGSILSSFVLSSFVFPRTLANPWERIPSHRSSAATSPEPNHFHLISWSQTTPIQLCVSLIQLIIKAATRSIIDSRTRRRQPVHEVVRSISPM